MAFLERIHHNHFCMEIASKVREEDRVAALLNYLSLRVDEHCAHAIIPRLRRRQCLRTRDNPKVLVSVMRAFR